VATSYLTRVVEFTARHYLRRADWPAARNAQEFGRAAGDHEHRYRCGVTVKGSVSAATGGVMNLGALDAILAAEITARFDGKSINEAVPEFADGRSLPTGEALAVFVWERIARRLPPGVTLHAVRVQESDHIYSEYFGEP
jgi:6-pyruvoyltetrahydropterin/6-carboxytetrahydropterin synthase